MHEGRRRRGGYTNRLGGRARERGSVLAVVLVLLLALELLAHGALLMARQEEAASRAGERLLQARLAARRGLHAGTLPPGAALRAVPLGGSVELGRGVLGAARWRARLERLGREAWLVRSSGGVRGAGWSLDEAVLAWLPDPVARLAAFGAVLVVARGAPMSVLGSVEVGAVRRDVGPDAGACAPWWYALDSLYAATPPPAVVAADPSPAGEPSLGPLGPDELLGWIGASAATAGARAVPGDLTLHGEDTEGLLVVAGDLDLRGGRHRGLVLVGGTLRLTDGAELVGFARIGGGVEVARGAGVKGSGCSALRALAEGTEGWVRPLTRGNRAFPLP